MLARPPNWHNRFSKQLPILVTILDIAFQSREPFLWLPLAADRYLFLSMPTVGPRSKFPMAAPFLAPSMPLVQYTLPLLVHCTSKESPTKKIPFFHSLSPFGRTILPTQECGRSGLPFFCSNFGGFFWESSKIFIENFPWFQVAISQLLTLMPHTFSRIEGL